MAVSRTVALRGPGGLASEPPYLRGEQASLASRQRADAALPRTIWGEWVACSRQPRMYTGVPGVGTSVWKNAAMCVGIRTQPWEAGRRGTWVSPWIAKVVPMKNTGLYIA